MTIPSGQETWIDEAAATLVTIALTDAGDYGDKALASELTTPAKA